MPTLRMGLKSWCCYHLNVHGLIVWTVAAGESSVKTFWLETFAIPRTISYPNFGISWHNTATDVNDVQCESQNQFHFPKPVWKGMVKIATYIVTDLLYVQIAIQIFIYDLQEQIPREGAIVCTSKEARCPYLLNWQCFTDHTWWLQTNLLVQYLYVLLYCHKEILWMNTSLTFSNTFQACLCRDVVFLFSNKCRHCITTLECMREWQCFWSWTQWLNNILNWYPSQILALSKCRQ